MTTVTKKKIWIRIPCILAAVVLIVWIVCIHIQAYNENRGEDNHILAMYDSGLLFLSNALDTFDTAQNFDDQLVCLQAVTEELNILSAQMEMSHPFIEGDTGMYASDAQEAKIVANLIETGGMVNGQSIPSFKEDGKISADEAAVLQQLQDEVETLRNAMRKNLEEQGGSYEYVLQPSELFQRVTAIMQETNAAMLRAD